MEDVKVITVRMPMELHQRLVKLSEREHRSVNAQVVCLIDQAAR